MEQILTMGKSPLLYEYPRHCHKFWEVVYYIYGSGVIIVEDKTIPFKEGDIICIPPEMHHHEIAQDGGFRNIYVNIRGFNDFGVDIPVFHDNEAKDFLNILNVVHNCFWNKEGNWERLVDIMLNLLTEYLFVWNESKVVNRYVEQYIKNIIENIPNSNYSMSSFAETLSISNAYLIKLFKNETNHTPNEYLTLKRITHAKHLLKTREITNMKIKDVARKCGYDDPLYFSKVFKKLTGQSPEKYS